MKNRKAFVLSVLAITVLLPFIARGMTTAEPIPSGDDGRGRQGASTEKPVKDAKGKGVKTPAKDKKK